MPDRGEESRGIPEKLGEFRLLERLGAGGMGVVYRARDELLSRDVALKLVLPEHLAFEEARERFRREVEAAAKLRHPGIVPIYSVGQDGTLPYFAMELVEGTSLASVIESFRDRRPSELAGADMRDAIRAATRRFAARDTSTSADAAVFTSTWVQACCRIVLQVADALHHAHENGVVHRDVKPSNVIVKASGRAMLFDFGVASTEEASRITRTGSQVGSLPYMPPERVRGEAESGDPRGDVYSLGVTLYELLTLRLPFEGKTIQEMFQAILAGDVPRVSERNPSVPWDAATVCATAMERDPGRRYPTADAFARDLRNLLELRPITARAPSKTLRVRRWVQRHPTLSLGAALSFLLLVVAPSIAVWRIGRERDVALRELRTKDGMLEFLLNTLRGADAESGSSGDRTVFALLDDASKRLRETQTDDAVVQARLLADIATLQAQLGRTRESADLARQALELFRVIEGEDGPSVHRVKRDLALSLLKLGEVDEGTRLIEDLRLAGASGHLEDPLASAAASLDGAFALLSQERPEDARLLLERVAADPAFEREAPPLTRIAWLTNMAAVCRALGERARAIELDRRAVELARSEMGDGHQEVSMCLQNLAVNFNESGDAEEALRLLIEARDIRRRLQSYGSIEDARLEYNLGASFKKLGRHAESVDAFARSLELCRACAGDSAQTARAATGLGIGLTNSGRPAEAEPVLREAVELGNRFIPRTGLPAMEAPFALARCLVALGRHEEAVPLFEEAVGFAEGAPSIDGVLLAKWQGEVADALEAIGRTAEAGERRERQRRALESSKSSEE